MLNSVSTEHGQGQLVLVADSNGTYSTPITLALGVQAQFTVDTGSFDHQASQLILDKMPGSHTETDISGQLQGIYLTEAALIRNLPIGTMTEYNLHFSSMPASLYQGGLLSLLGMSLWQNYRMTFDIPRKALYLEPNPVEKFLVPHAKAGVVLTRKGSTIQVQSLELNSPAIRAGLRIGDTITAVDGVSATGEEISAMKRLLDGFAGTKARIEVMRGIPQVSQTLHFLRTDKFKPIEKPFPCFQGVVGNILFGKPMVIFSLKSDAPLYTAGVRVGEQVLNINGKELAQQKE